ncbi:uncharacterized protein LOC108682232 [Hyalella azteca]|uniref:Uncharacterized protein LOC108682232 n=1 Tax=Hyalella azteca TaxID=294128 RepID=A0A8B7PN51_HYAAZ|nr:uncharacterized protein LOC108682232 [Hyalella azteca]
MISKCTASAALDQTNFFKSCIKTLQARSKASGTLYPPSRIFPAKNVPNGNANKSGSKKPSISVATFFQKAREVQENIVRLKQLLMDRRKVFIGRINDPASMTPEQCAVMDQILTEKLKIVDQQIAELEAKISSATFMALKKTIWSSPRPGKDLDIADSNPGRNISTNEAISNTVDKPNDIVDVECCMAITACIVRAHLADLKSIYSSMKEAKQQKENMKAKLMRLHRPAYVEKNSTIELRLQQQKECEQASVVTNNRKKVEQEDWRDDDDTCSLSRIEQLPSSAATKKMKETTNFSQSAENYSKDPSSVLSENNSLFRIKSPDQNLGKEAKSSNALTSSEAPGAMDSYHRPYIFDYDNSILSPEETNVLEQENLMIYNELQSAHEEVRQITKQVVELGRLQDVLLESVQEQAVVADNVQQHVMAATDNVQEGNEQIREAMRKDASFRVWILFFLIMMSLTILFLVWYND